MARCMDSPELFGYGVGSSTCGDFTCGICGTKYNEGNDKTERYDGESVLVTDFAGLSVCGDCFEVIENEIFNRMPDILRWYKKIIDEKTKRELQLKKQVEELL